MFNPDQLPKDASKILEQVKPEIQLAQNFVKPKRVEFRSRLKLYNNQRKQKDKIGDTSIFNIITTLMAVNYIDRQQAEFEGRDITDARKAGNIQKVADFDYDEMEMEVIDYTTHWDRFFFGVGIKWLSGWDEERKTPLPKSMDTISWLPDPSGFLSGKNFRFMGFESEYVRSELTEEAGFFNLEKLPTKKSNDSELAQTMASYREAQGLDNPEADYSKSENTEAFDMIDWLTEIEDEDAKEKRKYLLTVSADCKELYRCEYLEPVSAKEKKNPCRVPFPVSLHYYSPTRHDPFGVSVCDLTEDKQRAKSVLKNLRIAIRKADLYPMYMYNRDKVLNRRDLDFAFNKFVAIRGDVGDNVIRPINKVATKQGETLNDEGSLDSDMSKATGSDENAQGVLSDEQRTLGEVERVTANANLRFVLGARINSWGEKRFWKLWYRLYKQNFKDGNTKEVRLKSAFGTNFLSFNRKDFITKEDPDIKIVSKMESDKKKAQERASFGAIVGIINADPTKPRASKRFAERHLLRLHGIPEETISIMSPETPDEMRAKQENELLSRNNAVKVDMLNEDHLSHMIIHSSAEETAERNAHIELHRMAYLESGQKDQDEMLEAGMVPNEQNQGNQAQNQISNQNSQLNNKPTPEAVNATE